VGQAGLAQSGRSVEQDVVQGFFTAFGSRDRYFKVILGLVLSGKISQVPGSQAGIQRCILDTWLA
jgi:hypothetical protein